MTHDLIAPNFLKTQFSQTTNWAALLHTSFCTRYMITYESCFTGKINTYSCEATMKEYVISVFTLTLALSYLTSVLTHDQWKKYRCFWSCQVSDLTACWFRREKVDHDQHYEQACVQKSPRYFLCCTSEIMHAALKVIYSKHLLADYQMSSYL